MGFLTSNKPRNKRKYYEKNEENKTKEKAFKNKPIVVDQMTLDQLPTEILQIIFIYSANLDLPICSKSIYHKLTGTSYLKNELLEANKIPTRIKIENQIEGTSMDFNEQSEETQADGLAEVNEPSTNGNIPLDNEQPRHQLKKQTIIAYYIPAIFIEYRFVTAELLQEMGITGITDSRFLSLGLINQRKIKLASYLIQQGNTILPDSLIFETAIKLKMKSEIEIFKNVGPLIVPCDYKCLMAAINNGFIHLAKHIISLETFENEDIDMWKQLLSSSKQVIGFLRDEGLHPPAQVLFGKA